MMRDLLPPEIMCVSTRCDDPAARLLPEEAAQFGWAVPARRQEFITGRSCARKALAALGMPPVPILRGANREPLWPPGVVGSITHCASFRAAAVAREAQVLSVGIDAEPHEALPDGVSALVLADPERASLTGAKAGIHWDRVIFSAKESVFKAWYPLTGRWLDFQDATVTFDLPNGTFDARLLIRPPIVRGRPLAGFIGRFRICDGLVLTSVAMLQADWIAGGTPMC